jgi:hypothetical protein
MNFGIGKKYSVFWSGRRGGPHAAAGLFACQERARPALATRLPRDYLRRLRFKFGRRSVPFTLGPSRLPSVLPTGCRCPRHRDLAMVALK